MTPIPLILSGALALAAATGNAQTVWRCGNSYSTQPCTGGSSFEAMEAPGKEEAERARNAAKADLQRATELEKARLAQERNAPGPIVIGPTEPAAREAPDGKKGKPPARGKPEAFTASAPGKKAKP